MKLEYIDGDSLLEGKYDRVVYDKFIEAGKYTLKATIGNKQFEQSINVRKGVSPYIQ